MLCEICKTANATVHITDIVAGERDEMRKRDLCEACFKQTDQGKSMGGNRIGWTNYSPGSTVFLEQIDWTEHDEAIDGEPFRVRFRILGGAFELEVFLDGEWGSRQTDLPPSSPGEFEILINRLTRRAVEK